MTETISASMHRLISSFESRLEKRLPEGYERFSDFEECRSFLRSTFFSNSMILGPGGTGGALVDEQRWTIWESNRFSGFASRALESAMDAKARRPELAALRVRGYLLLMLSMINLEVA